MSNTKITLGLLALGLALSSAAVPALAESSKMPEKRVVVVAKPAVAGFVATSNSGFTRRLAEREIYADSLRSR